MNWQEYLKKFDDVLDGINTAAPYDNEVYQEYVKLNKSRVNRWMKRSILLQDTLDTMGNVSIPQKWILITEPWCGDAAHNIPFIYLMSELSDKVDLDIQLRDSNSIIDQYLTDGNRSIPKLIARDEKGNDLFTWGARPEPCQDLHTALKSTELSNQEQKMKIQSWCNQDMGETVQRELIELIGSL